MKKLCICICLALLACMFWVVAPGQAATGTITFDEFPPGPIDDLYGDVGVHFAPPAGAPDNDAEIVAGGTWGITGPNGPQFLGCDGIVGQYGKSSGFVVELDFDPTSFSFDFTIGNGTTTSKALTCMPIRNGTPVFDSIVSVPLPGVNQWVSVDLSGACPFEAAVVFVATDDTTEAFLGFDNMAIGGIPCDLPIADFEGTPVSGEEPLTVSFTDVSTGAASWDWDFGDGSGSSDQDPTHEYAAAGTYTVSLTVTNDCGEDTETKVDYITVSEACIPPVADFEGSPTAGTAPLTVSFTDLSTGATAWLWYFGDGSGITSTEQNPTYTYQAAGVYTVSLRASNACGNVWEVKEDYIVVTEECNTPVADFEASQTSGLAPLAVDFTDLSVGAISWSWNFGDGSAVSTEQNPSHTYTNPGTYTVTLTAANDCGTDTVTKTDYITVEDETCDPITAAFEGTPVSGSAPLTVQFTDLSNGAVSWYWTFGDQTSSLDQNPIHTYENPGTYNVYLYVTNSCEEGDWEYKAGYITVTDECVEPDPAFSADPSEGEAPLTVQFTDQSTADPTAWSWDFGDGSVSDQQNPVHTYAQEGVYTVTLTVANDCGSATTFVVDYITVYAPQDTIHVNEIDVTLEWQMAWWMFVRAEAEVQIVDQDGAPVANAAITGEWSDDAEGTVTIITDDQGWASCRTDWVRRDFRNGNIITFCVNDVVKPDWTYNPAANVETCDAGEL